MIVAVHAIKKPEKIQDFNGVASNFAFFEWQIHFHTDWWLKKLKNHFAFIEPMVKKIIYKHSK